MKKQMRKIGFSAGADDENEIQQGDDFFEQMFAKQKESIRQFISAKYLPTGHADNMEFRTSLELEYELREMINASTNALNAVMNDLGFQVQFIEDSPNWVVYTK